MEFGVNEGDLRIFVMANGAEFIGEVRRIDGFLIYLIKPLTLNKLVTSDGKTVIQIVPVLMNNPFLKETQDFPINFNMVVTCAVPSKKMADEYRAARSGLVTGNGFDKKFVENIRQ